jgi:predicted PurR-regulated permease PerM
MLYYRNHFKVGVLRLFGQKNNVEHMIDDAQHMISRYLLGVVNVMVILFFFNVIGLWLIGVKYPLLWATIGAVGYIIPYIGIIIAAILPVTFTLLSSPTLVTPLLVVILFVLNQMLENNILTPYIVGYHIRMNPLVLMIAFVVGGYAWGVIGMILFVPLLSVVHVICRYFPQTQPIAYMMKRPMHESNNKE